MLLTFLHMRLCNCICNAFSKLKDRVPNKYFLPYRRFTYVLFQLRCFSICKNGILSQYRARMEANHEEGGFSCMFYNTMLFSVFDVRATLEVRETVFKMQACRLVTVCGNQRLVDLPEQ